jgi:hypothetical protein
MRQLVSGLMCTLLPAGLAAQQGNIDPGSLDALQDIVVAAAVPFWPPAPAWYWLAAALALLLLRSGLGLLRKHQQNQYRREAKQQLELLQNRKADAAEVSALLKRVACYVAGRERVASLSGMDWVAWLNQQCAHAPFQGQVQTLLAESMYQGGAQHGNEELKALFEQANAWIRSHRVTPEVSR